MGFPKSALIRMHLRYGSRAGDTCEHCVQLIVVGTRPHRSGSRNDQLGCRLFRKEEEKATSMRWAKSWTACGAFQKVS